MSGCAVLEWSQSLHEQTVARIKVLAGLDVAERRRPQDGRFLARVASGSVDVRVSTLPKPHGESVDLRILSRSYVEHGLEGLGLDSGQVRLLHGLLEKPVGVVLVTGPTGSGKTTTLYTCLQRLKHLGRKIISVEDPIEYETAGVTQVQVRPEIGLTFASVLRAMLRHDPDVMMVGEMRDAETAATTVQVALTGHLVLSTLHTHDAATAPARLAVSSWRRPSATEGALGGAHQRRGPRSRRLRLVNMVAAAMTLGWTYLAVAREIKVPTDEPTIQEAVDSAAPGDSIVILAGVYEGPGNRDVRVSVGGLYVLGAGSGNTIVECGELGRGFWFDAIDANRTVLAGMTIRNGRHIGPGGGVLVSSQAALSFNDVVLSECTAEGANARGGGICIREHAQVDLRDCLIYRCTADGSEAGGGGMYVTDQAVASLRSTTIELCRAHFFDGNPLGGGVLASGASVLTLEHATVRRNNLRRYTYYGGGDGGGVAVVEGSVAKVVDSVIEGNLAGVDDFYGSGAGIFVGDGARLECRASLLRANLATIGGGIYGEQGGYMDVAASMVLDNAALDVAGVYVSSGIIQNTMVAGNVAFGTKGYYGRGGGVAIHGKRVVVRGCTIMRNQGLKASGLYVHQQADVLLDRSIVWGNCDDRDRTPGLDIWINYGGLLHAQCSTWDSAWVEADGELEVIGEAVHTEPFVCGMLPCGEDYVAESVWELWSGSPCTAGNSPCDATIGATAKECDRLGACCTSETACWTLEESACLVRGGVYAGDGVDCDPMPCWGACCLPSGECVYVSAESCGEASGAWTGSGILCDQAGCAAGGACCLDDGSCLVRTSEACDSANGIYWGDGSVCEPMPCPPAGACCVPGDGCRIRTEDACRSVGGTYLGDDVSCDLQQCGVNAGGVLLLSANSQLVYTNDGGFCGQSENLDCNQSTYRVDDGDVVIAHVLAAFIDGSSPAVTLVGYGVAYDPQRLVVIDYEGCGDTEHSDAEWPAPGSGTLVQWSTPETAEAFEVGWFAAYRYGLAGSALELVAHPEAGAVFWDASFPPVADPVACLGALGFGVDGRSCCPDVARGACCGVGAECAMSSRDDCLAEGNVFLGYGVDCVTDPCPTTSVEDPGTAVEAMSIDLVGEHPGAGLVRVAITVGRSGHARLELFDAVGRKVAGVYEGDVSSGTHVFEHPVSTNGVYFIALRMDGRRVARRVLVVD